MTNYGFDTVPVTDDNLSRMESFIRPFPFPSEYTPTRPGTMRAVSDEVLMRAAPQVIVHMQRTVSQGGFQVVSPRQTPLSWVMTRVAGGRKEIGDHVVGSVASENTTWPTLDDADMSSLLPDEPLPAYGNTRVTREKTRTEPLTKASALMADPILACLVKGRAVIDVLSRNDVDGGWHELTELLATAWGIPTKDLVDMDAFTLGYDGPLLRHAIKADDVYPMIHAPIHKKKCISVGLVEASREYLPEDSALDWRRLRVFAEAVFMMTLEVEGKSLAKIRCAPPPGDPSAELGRPGTLAFRVAPCTAWSFSPSTFRIIPVGTLSRQYIGAVPPEVMAALTRYVGIVRPMSYALTKGYHASTRQTMVIEPVIPEGETISDTYRTLTRTVMTGTSRGKKAMPALRNAVYRAMENAPDFERMRLARFLTSLREEVKIHLGMEVVPDGIIDTVAARFLTVGGNIRMEVAAEAARRGETAEDWWADATAQTPDRYKLMKEGTLGWARVAMWLLLREPTPKWVSLAHAIRHRALALSSIEDAGAMPLPTTIGSPERLLAACRKGVKEMTKNFAGYYSGMLDVALAIAGELDARGDPHYAGVLREAGYLWAVRSRAFTGTNVEVKSHDTRTRSDNHLRVKADPVDVVIVPAPYRAYNQYAKHARESRFVSSYAKTMLTQPIGTTVSSIFKAMDRPMGMARRSTLTQYLMTPAKLGQDLERAWFDLSTDVGEMCLKYGAPPKVVHAESIVTTPTVLAMPAGSAFDVFAHLEKLESAKPVLPGMSYLEAWTVLDVETQDWVDDVLSMAPDMEREVSSRRYTSTKELLILIEKIEDEGDVTMGGGEASEAVH